MTIAVIKRDARPQVIVSGANSAEVRRQAALSEAAADRAETAAGFAEEFGGPAYATQAAGQAATAVGQFFRVSNGDTPRTYTRYERTSGGSVVAAPLATTASLSASGGAALIGYARASEGGEDVFAKLGRHLEVEDFRYDLLGVARSDRETLERAFTAWQAVGSGKLEAEAGRIYNLGNISTPGISEIFSIEGLRNAVFEGNGCFIRLTSTALGVRPFLFALRNYENLTFQNVKVQDYGTDLTVDWRGVYAFCPIGDTSGFIQSGLTLDNVYAAFTVAFLFVSGTVSDVSGITVKPNCNASACYYGMLFQEAGNDVTASLRTIDCRRSYFPYGVRGHKIQIHFNHGPTSPGAEAMCLIKRYQRDTGDIDLTVFAKGSCATFDNIVKLEHQPNTGTGPSTIENISITFALAPTLQMDMSDAACDLYNQPHGSKTKPLTLSSYLADITEETTTTVNVWKKIKVAGSLSVAPGDHIVARVRPTKPADISVMPEVGLNPVRCNTLGNIVFKTANNREFRTFKGNLTAANAITIDLSGFDNVSTVVGVNALLAGAIAGTATQDRTYFELNTFLTIPAGGPITINTTPSPVLNSSGVAATIGTLTASGKVITIPVTGAAYSGSNAFALVETIYRDQVPAR